METSLNSSYENLELALSDAIPINKMKISLSVEP